MAQKGILGTVTYCCRHAMSKVFNVAPPDMAPEVRNLLAELHFSNRDLNKLFRIFQNCRQHDPITVGTLENEVCVSSLLLLVRNDRKYIVKILETLFELGGYVTIATWEAFSGFCCSSAPYRRLSSARSFSTSLQRRPGAGH